MMVRALSTVWEAPPGHSKCSQSLSTRKQTPRNAPRSLALSTDTHHTRQAGVCAALGPAQLLASDPVGSVAPASPWLCLGWARKDGRLLNQPSQNIHPPTQKQQASQDEMWSSGGSQPASRPAKPSTGPSGQGGQCQVEGRPGMHMERAAPKWGLPG